MVASKQLYTWKSLIEIIISKLFMRSTYGTIYVNFWWNNASISFKITISSINKKIKNYPIDQNGNQDPEYTLAILYSLVRNLFSAFCSSCSIVSVYLLQSESSRKDHSIPSPLGMQVQVITSCKFFDLPYKILFFLLIKMSWLCDLSWKAEITWVQGWTHQLKLK